MADNSSSLYFDIALLVKEDLEELLEVIVEVCEIPLAMITLFKGSTQFYIVAKGTDRPNHPLKKSFCQYLDPAKGLLEIADVRKDIRFKLPTSHKQDPEIIFYAGYPIVSRENNLVGSVCLADHHVRTLSAVQRKCFITLSNQIIHLLEFKRTESVNKSMTSELKQQKEETDSLLQKLRAYFDSSPSLHILLDVDMNVLDFNKEAISIIKKHSKKQIKSGEPIINFIAKDYSLFFKRFFKLAMKGRRVARDVQIRYGDVMIWWRITLRPIFNDDRMVVAVAYSAMNIHETRTHLEEITRQNESLQQIAIIQSHEYRKPVASILGLIELIKMDQFDVNEDVIAMLETAILELDEKIRKVVKYSENDI